jgi:hypothetical protein
VIIFQKQIKGIEKLEISEKLMKYRGAMLVRSATIEGACFLFIVCALQTGSMVFFFEAIFCLVILIFFFPTSYRIAKEIKRDLRDFDQ